MDADAVVLARALGAPDVAEIAAAIGPIGGVRGLWITGGEPLASRFTPKRRERLLAILELITRAQKPRTMPSAIERPEDLIALLGPELIASPVETFWVVALDARARPKGVTQIARGTLSACLVHPREVFAAAIRDRAASVLLAHNHPSGSPEPSPEDLSLTERLTEAGELLGIPVIDHVIVAEGGFCSLGGARPGPRSRGPHMERRARP
jgi:DNA repair protein RadC